MWKIIACLLLATSALAIEVPLNVPDPVEYPPVTPGTYNTVIVKVIEYMGMESQPVWIIVARIADGPFINRLVFDQWTWDFYGMRRTAKIFRDFGYDGQVDTLIVHPIDLYGCAAQLTVSTRWFMGRDVSMVTFSGWAPP